MKSNKAMPMIAGALIVIAAVLGFIAFKNAAESSTTGGEQVIIRAQNPDDPKYKPDPKLGLSGGGQR